MKFRQLAEYLQKLEATSSRLTITHELSALFKELTPEEIEKTVYLLQGRVVPSFAHIEFGMAEKMVVKSIIAALQLDQSDFAREYRTSGDLGRAVEHFKKHQRHLHEKDLTVLAVYEELYTMATAEGVGAVAKKTAILSNLITQLDGLSTRFLVRIPTGALRFGFSDMTVLDAFSWMLKGDKSLRPVIEKGYHVRPDLGFIGRTLKEQGVHAVEKIKPEVFTPIIMMRAERLTTGLEIIKKIGKCGVESKYDGFRLQAHIKKIKDSSFAKASKDKQKSNSKKNTTEVRLYSRSLDDVSLMYPDIIEGILKEVTAETAILEGEAIGYDTKARRFLPFQETSTRKRKYDIAASAKKIPLKFFTFELLYCNGVSYIDKPFTERRAQLEAIIDQKGNVNRDTVLTAVQEITADPHQVEHLWKEAIRLGFEGIVAKKLDGVYQAGARGWNWIKLKKSYAEKVTDTIDALVMGYDTGRGKRVGFGLGAFLVGVYDPKLDKFVTVAKIGTGLTDVEWKELFERCQKNKVSKKPAAYDVDNGMECDVWVSPRIVVEIRADEITRSAVHTAGRTLKASKSGSAKVVDTPGFALRFPRLERFRPDRRPDDATTLAEVASLFKKQRK